MKKYGRFPDFFPTEIFQQFSRDQTVKLFTLNSGLRVHVAAFNFSYNLFMTGRLRRYHWMFFSSFYARQHIMLRASYSHRRGVRPSVRASHSGTVNIITQATITKSSPWTATKTLVLGSVKLSPKFKRSLPDRGR